jgi:hypothetical protein
VGYGVKAGVRWQPCAHSLCKGAESVHSGLALGLQQALVSLLFCRGCLTACGPLLWSTGIQWKRATTPALQCSLCACRTAAAGGGSRSLYAWKLDSTSKARRGPDSVCEHVLCSSSGGACWLTPSMSASLGQLQSTCGCHGLPKAALTGAAQGASTGTNTYQHLFRVLLGTCFKGRGHRIRGPCFVCLTAPRAMWVLRSVHGLSVQQSMHCEACARYNGPMDVTNWAIGTMRCWAQQRGNGVMTVAPSRAVLVHVECPPAVGATRC